MLTRHTTEPADHPTRSLNLVVSALALLLAIYASVFSWQSWQDENAALLYNLQNIMTLEERAVDTYFTQLERDILAMGIGIIGTDDKIDIEHAYTLAERFNEGHLELRDISVIREDGQLLFSTEALPGHTLPTLAQEPSFQKFRDEIQEGRPVSIGQPHVCPIHNKWSIPLRYVISSKGDKLMYIISADLPIGMLQNYWKDAPFTKTAALGLIRDDGFLVGRYPMSDKLETEEIYGIPRKATLITYLRQHQFPQNGYVRGPSSLDGSDYLNSFHRLEHFPITLFIAMPMSEIRTAWWNKVKVPYFLTLVLFLGGFFIYRVTFQRERTREMERFHASEAIRESEDRFRNLFERNVAIMLIIDPDTGNIIQANKAASDFYGWPIELLSNMCIQEINTLPSEAVMNEMNKAMSSGSIHLASRHRRADNSIRDVDVFRSKIEIHGKAFLYSIIHDITERKQAEEKIKELNRDFISLLENTGDFIYFKDENSHYRFCSQTVANITGHASWRDIIGKHSLDVFPEEMSHIYYEEVFPVLREGKPLLNKVNPFYDTLGNKGWASTSKWPLINGEGEVVGLFGISRDITDRKLAEEELRRSEEFVKNVLDTLQENICVLDITGTIVMVNRKWREFADANPPAPENYGVGVNYLTVCAAAIDDNYEDSSLFTEGIRAVCSGERISYEQEYPCHSPTEQRWFRLQATRFVGSDQAMVVISHENITERIEWERQRMQIEKAQSLNRMAAAIGHHCNSQLYAVVHNLGLVLDVLPLGSDESERLIDAMKASHRAADVSRQMLTYLGQAPGKLELQDLSETCHKGLLMLQAFIPKNVSMEPAISFPGPTIRANMSQMHQIFTSLVTNAWESIFDNKGTITISVKTVSAADISLLHRFPANWSPKENLYACLEVADTGSGITNADMEKVFDPFFSTKFVDRGLDLAVILRIVSNHAGGLTVESEIGKGSIFRVFLPVSAEAVSVSVG
jgi:PAS domain S-box-containing protein